jgi:hypothetical protein
LTAIAETKTTDGAKTVCKLHAFAAQLRSHNFEHSASRRTFDPRLMDFLGASLERITERDKKVPFSGLHN